MMSRKQLDKFTLAKLQDELLHFGITNPPNNHTACVDMVLDCLEKSTSNRNTMSSQAQEADGTADSPKSSTVQPSLESQALQQQKMFKQMLSALSNSNATTTNQSQVGPQPAPFHELDHCTTKYLKTSQWFQGNAAHHSFMWYVTQEVIASTSQKAKFKENKSSPEDLDHQKKKDGFVHTAMVKTILRKNALN
ncbi:unnamed protein product [Lasius platythorax]|uniref:Uncharacterized protein n=1 Tax=Lasius platythorax TaxID=488582 RepID=A0AAV2MX61_9HYME